MGCKRKSCAGALHCSRAVCALLQLCIALEQCVAEIALLQQSVRCSSCVLLQLCVHCSSCALLSSSALLKLRCFSRVCAAPAVRCSNCAAPAKINLFALPHLSSVNFECVGVNAQRVDLKFCGAQLCAVRKQDTPPRARFFQLGQTSSQVHLTSCDFT